MGLRVQKDFRIQNFLLCKKNAPVVGLITFSICCLNEEGHIHSFYKFACILILLLSTLNVFMPTDTAH